MVELQTFCAQVLLDINQNLIKVYHMARIKLTTDAVLQPPINVLSWRKRVGQKAAKGDVILWVESNQGVVEVAAPVAGVLSGQLVKPGQLISPGDVLAEFDGAIVAAPAVSAQNSGGRVAGQVIKQPAGQATQGQIAQQNVKSSALSQVGAANTANKRDMNMSQSEPSSLNVTPVLMPQAGQSMEEGVIVQWHVKPGDQIKEGDVIFEIETDKATMDVEAQHSGRLSRIVAKIGEFIPVLQPVAYLADNDADVDQYLAQQGGGAAGSAATEEPVGGEATSQAAAVPQTVAMGTTSEGGRVKASPAARQVAAQRGVDLASVTQGTGPGGRILSTDVPAAPVARPAAAAASASATVASAAVPAVPVQAGPVVPAPAGAVRKRLSSMRKAIARNLSLSKSTIPHWYLGARVDAGALLSFYKGQKAKYPCSLNDVIVMASAKAMVEFPMFRSRFDGDSILEFPTANIGIAVGMDDGLVVPVVVGAEAYTLEKLGEETKRLANQARAGKIENMGAGTFTISNLGMFGVDEFTAIVNPPEAAILAVGAAQDDVIVKDGAMKLGKVMKITLSSDHRLIDGTLGAQFMKRLKELLEKPIELLK